MIFFRYYSILEFFRQFFGYIISKQQQKKFKLLEMKNFAKGRQ